LREPLPAVAGLFEALAPRLCFVLFMTAPPAPPAAKKKGAPQNFFFLTL
jgi:hypothetical protein